MHNKYIVNSIASCYAKIIEWLDYLPMYAKKYTSLNFSGEIHTVSNLNTSYYDEFITNNNFVYVSFSSIPTSKTYISSNVDMEFCVYKNNLNEFYVVVCLDKKNNRILFFTTDVYDFSKSCFDQKYNPYVKRIAAKKTTSSVASEYCNIHNVSYIAVATLAVESSTTELYCNSFDNCINISTVDASSYTRHTYNVFFGVIKQHRYYKGGHYFCGSACGNVEMFDTFGVRESSVNMGEVDKSVANLTYKETRINFIPDPTYAEFGWHINSGSYSTDDVDINSDIVKRLESIYKLYFFNGFDFYLRIDIDTNPDKSKYWASNVSREISDSLFINAYSSLTRDNIDLPTYKNEISNSPIDPGRFINQSNGISLVMPMVIYVQREPLELDNYSSVGIFDYVSVVSMYNCSSGSINDVSYPIETNTIKYQCFSLYRRRMNHDFLDTYSWQKIRYGYVGYVGLAVRQDEYEYPIVDWSLISELREDKLFKDLNNANTGISAYSGNIDFDVRYKSGIFKINFTKGFLPLTVPYTYFTKLRIIYTDLSCTTLYTYEIDCLSLKAKLDVGGDFNLLDDGNGYNWIIGSNSAYTIKSVQLHTKYADCGMVDIFGI